MVSEDYDGRRDGYLAALRRIGSVSKAIEAVGIVESTVHDWRTDPDFSRDERLVLDDLETQMEIKVQRMAVWYRAGLTITALSDRYGIPKETVRMNLKRAGVKLRPRGRMPSRLGRKGRKRS